MIDSSSTVPPPFQWSRDPCRHSCKIECVCAGHVLGATSVVKQASKQASKVDVFCVGKLFFEGEEIIELFEVGSLVVHYHAARDGAEGAIGTGGGHVTFSLWIVGL